jgi:hypothetical protein
MNVQPFVKKCFEAVQALQFEQDLMISGCTSIEGERIPYDKSVDPKGERNGVEQWLLQVLVIPDVASMLNFLNGLLNTLIVAAFSYSEPLSHYSLQAVSSAWLASHRDHEWMVRARCLSSNKQRDADRASDDEVAAHDHQQVSQGLRYYGS